MSTGNDDDDDDDDDDDYYRYEEGLRDHTAAALSAYTPRVRTTHSTHKTTPQTAATTAAAAAAAGRNDLGVRQALDSQINSLTQQLTAAGAYMSQLSGRLTDLEGQGLGQGQGQGQGLGQGQGQGLGLGLSSATPSKPAAVRSVPGTHPFQLATTLQTPDNYNYNRNNNSAVYGNESFLQANIMSTGARAGPGTESGSDTAIGIGTSLGIVAGPHHQLGLDVVEMNRELYFEKSR